MKASSAQALVAKVPRLNTHSLTHKAQALLSGDNSPDEFTRKVSSSVKRIAFMGTPHRGSDKAKWAETGRNLLSYIMDTNGELLKDLEENSERLSMIGREFPNLLRRREGKPEEKIEIMCFYEELKFRGVARVMVSQ